MFSAYALFLSSVMEDYSEVCDITAAYCVARLSVDTFPPASLASLAWALSQGRNDTKMKKSEKVFFHPRDRISIFIVKIPVAFDYSDGNCGIWFPIVAMFQIAEAYTTEIVLDDHHDQIKMDSQ